MRRRLLFETVQLDGRRRGVGKRRTSEPAVAEIMANITSAPAAAHVSSISSLKPAKIEVVLEEIENTTGPPPAPPGGKKAKKKSVGFQADRADLEY
jgi:hypothetical protein